METGADSRTGRIIALTGEYRCQQCGHTVQLIEGDFAPPCRGKSHRDERGRGRSGPVMPGATVWGLQWGGTMNRPASNSSSRDTFWGGRRPSTWIPNDDCTSIQRLLDPRDPTVLH